MILPDEMDDNLSEILGRVCCQCIDLAQLLRANGHTIKRRAEDEQAAVIFWLLGFYAVAGAKWRQAAAAQIEAWIKPVDITEKVNLPALPESPVAIPPVPRCGDHVVEKTSRDKLVVAFADASQNVLAWSGWPDGRGDLSNYQIVYRCTDAEHQAAVEDWRKLGEREGDTRRSNVLRRYGSPGRA
jgi:hypothetical protein